MASAARRSPRRFQILQAFFVSYIWHTRGGIIVLTLRTAAEPIRALKWSGVCCVLSRPHAQQYKQSTSMILIVKNTLLPLLLHTTTTLQ